MQFLSVVHGDNARAGIFHGLIEERGHQLEEWSLAWETPLPQPLDAYDGVLVFGGAMHADQDDRHPWLREENMFLQRVLDLQLPVLGVCLGSQLLAQAAGASVGRAPDAEIGWYEVERTAAGEDDPLLGRLPDRFVAFQWHYYMHGVPAGGVELARNACCSQAFRLGEHAWGVQFHPEVTFAQVESWIATEDGPVPDAETLLEATRQRIDGWNRLGRVLCEGFLEVAQRVGAPA